MGRRGDIKKGKNVKMQELVDECDLCQQCLSANVCQWYGEIHRPVKVFENNNAMIVGVLYCDFFKKQGPTSGGRAAG